MAILANQPNSLLRFYMASSSSSSSSSPKEEKPVHFVVMWTDFDDIHGGDRYVEVLGVVLSWDDGGELLRPKLIEFLMSRDEVERKSLPPWDAPIEDLIDAALDHRRGLYVSKLWDYEIEPSTVLTSEEVKKTVTEALQEEARGLEESDTDYHNTLCDKYRNKKQRTE